jgi:hypothetical protein
VQGGQKPLEGAMTNCRTNPSPRLKLWKIVTNPTVEVLAAIIVVILAAWIIVDSAPMARLPHAPMLFAK